LKKKWENKLVKNILKNKNCLITGATGGIGKEICKQLANYSCNLFLTSTNTKKLKKLKDELKKINKNIEIESFESDLTIEDNINELINSVKEKFSSIDIVINSAGIFMIESIEKSSIENFEKSMNINVKLPFILCKEFTKNMRKKKWGRIIMIGSSSSYSGFKNGSVYCMTKHSILGLSRALNAELKNNNVRILCISPASTQTNMAKISINQDFSTFLNPTEVAEYIIHVMCYDKEMIIDESRLSRTVMK
jgi:short-subunit dehydrogenase